MSRRWDAKIARYTAAVDQAPDLPSVLEALRGLQRQRTDLQAEGAYRRGLSQSAERFDRGGLTAEIRAWLEDWQGLLEEEAAQARQVLRKVFVGRLMWTPRVEAESTWYDYAVQTSYSRILAGIVGVKGMVPPG